jgi:hypothetical protein
MTEHTNLHSIPIMTDMITVQQSHYDALVTENTSLNNKILNLQGNAGMVKELQTQNDSYIKDIKELKQENYIQNTLMTDMQARITKLEEKDLFYKLAIAFQDINFKYQFDKAQDSPFKSIKFKRQLRNVQSHYLLKYGDNSDLIIYDKLYLLLTTLTKLTAENASNFEKLYGSGIIEAILVQLNTVLQGPKPAGTISQDDRDEYINWFST